MEFWLSWILLGALALLLLASCWFDVKSRIIPNELNLAIAVLAVPFWWTIGLAVWPDMLVQVGVAALVLAIFALAFAMGTMGGGDVKLVAAVSLWLPWPAVMLLIFIMSIAGGVLTAALYLRHKLAKRSERLEIPYGLAIAFGGLWLISERFLNQFG
jgi:prepilin peptidase CpaA